MRKKLKSHLHLFFWIALLTSCDILSLHPLAESDDIIMDEDLLGTWNEELLPDMIEEAKKRALKSSNADSLFTIITEPPTYVFTSHHPIYGIEKTSIDEIDGVWRKTEFNFQMRLTKIGDHFWACFTQGENNRETRSAYIGMHDFKVRANGIAKIDFEGGKMEMRFLKYKWFKNTITKNRMRIDHELVGSSDNPQIILTANTEQLRSLMRKLHEVEDAFEDPIILNKERP